MSPANNTKEDDISIEGDAELLALEKLLSNCDEEESVPSIKPAEKIAPTLENAVPRLRDDSSFADAFSYELPPAELKAAEKAAKTEDLDSSDDEEVKNFLERKYNQYGSDINKKLKQQREAAHDTKVAREVDSVLKANSANKNASNNEQSCHVKNPHKPVHRQSLVSSSFQQPVKQPARNDSTPTAPASAVFTDPVFGLRIINPLISSNMLVERMAGRKSVPFSGIAFHIDRGDLSKDWVIAGVLVNKLPARTTKKGDFYSTWRLSDLRGDIKMASLFLFRDAHKSLWKTAEGMCLAVLNPSIFEKRAGNNDVACLSIDNAQKVMILGQSKDLGICRAKKKNGDQCTAVVNLSECDYCVFHIKQEYGKMSRRSELQSATAGRGLNELRNKVLGKNEVFYGGQSFSAVPARKSAKLMAKDRERLAMLSEYAHSPFAASINHQSKPKSLVLQEVPFAPRGGPVSRLAGQVEVTSKQRLKDLERIKLLKAENERFKEQNASKTSEELTATVPSSPPTSKFTSKPQSTTPTSTSKLRVSTPKSTAKSQVSMPTTPKTPTTPNFVIPDKFKGRLFSSSLTATPKLSSDNFYLELNVSPNQAQAAKLKAAQILKKRPIEKVDPNSTRGTIGGKRRAVDDLHDLLTNSAKRHKKEEEEREANRKSRIERIMAATSSHKNLVDLREQDEQAKYFDKLEKKEAMEEKMLSTYKVPCKAVICQRCKYTAFSAAERCRQEQHPLKVVDAEKRFFQCKDCGNRTTSVFKLPKLSCSKCKGSQWIRTAMIRERKIVDGSENLSIRGDEETFLGSLAGGANLNLLVPDEEP